MISIPDLQLKTVIAVAQLDSDSLKKSLENINIDEIYKSGDSALTWALQYESDQVVENILKCGADPNQHVGGRYPIHIAVRWNRLNALKLLVQYGAKKTMNVEVNGENPLILSLSKPFIDIAYYLLSNGANASNQDFHLILNDSINCHRISIAKLVLKRMFENQKNYPIETNKFRELLFKPFIMAVREKQLDIVMEIVENDMANKNNIYILNHACQLLPYQTGIEWEEKSLNLVKYLIENGWKPAINIYSSGVSPLCIALSYKNYSVATYLIEQGANFGDSIEQILVEVFRNGQNLMSSPKCPFYVAIEYNAIEFLRMMFSKGFRMDSVQPFACYTPLTFALMISLYNERSLSYKKGTHHLVQLLLDNNADPSQADNIGMYPLHIAIRYGDRETIFKLIEHGAKIDQPSLNGLTPMNYAMSYNNSRTFSCELHILVYRMLKLRQYLDNPNKVLVQMLTQINNSSKHQDYIYVFEWVLGVVNEDYCRLLAENVELLNKGDYLTLTREKQVQIMYHIATEKAAVLMKEYFDKSALSLMVQIFHQKFPDADINKKRSDRILNFIQKTLERYLKLVLRFSYLKSRSLIEIYQPHIEQCLFEHGLLQNDLPKGVVNTSNGKFIFPKSISNIIATYNSRSYLEESSRVLSHRYANACEILNCYLKSEPMKDEPKKESNNDPKNEPEKWVQVVFSIDSTGNKKKLVTQNPAKKVVNTQKVSSGNAPSSCCLIQ